MTDNAEVFTPESITDSQVDQFFQTGELKADEKKSDGPVETAPKEENRPVAEDAAKGAEPEEETKPKEEKKVNLGALHEERAKRRSEEAARKKAEERAAQLEAQLQERMAAEVDNSDPLTSLAQRQKQVEDILLAQANAAFHQNQSREYWGKIRESELEFKAEKPDFDDSVQFLAKTRMEELADLGWDEKEAAKILSDEIKWIADKAYEDGANPAERFYNLAKRRGFAQSAPTETAQPKKLETIEKGQKANRALPPSSKSVKQDLTAEDLVDMNVDAMTNLFGQTEFDKAWAKVFGGNR